MSCPDTVWWVLNMIIVISTSYTVTLDLNEAVGIGLLSGFICPLVFYPYKWFCNKYVFPSGKDFDTLKTSEISEISEIS